MKCKTQTQTHTVEQKDNKVSQSSHTTHTPYMLICIHEVIFGWLVSFGLVSYSYCRPHFHRCGISLHHLNYVNAHKQIHRQFAYTTKQEDEQWQANENVKSFVSMENDLSMFFVLHFAFLFKKNMKQFESETRE